MPSSCCPPGQQDPQSRPPSGRAWGQRLSRKGGRVRSHEGASLAAAKMSCIRLPSRTSPPSGQWGVGSLRQLPARPVGAHSSPSPSEPRQPRSRRRATRSWVLQPWPRAGGLFPLSVSVPGLCHRWVWAQTLWLLGLRAEPRGNGQREESRPLTPQDPRTPARAAPGGAPVPVSACARAHTSHPAPAGSVRPAGVGSARLPGGGSSRAQASPREVTVRAVACLLRHVRSFRS